MKEVFTKIAKSIKERLKFGVSSPWVCELRKYEMLFGQDKDIKIEFNNNEPSIKMYIDSQDKYEALSKLLPIEKQFGNVIMKIHLIPMNNVQLSKLDLFRRAFADNPVVTDFISIPKEMTESTNDFEYVVFKKEVVQYHDDSLGDPHGNRSTLYQDIANEVFENREGIYFCTDKYES
jgi:hypothetical protein